MNKWSNLPNAHHIDWVIQSVKDNRDEWAAAYYAAYNAAWAAAWGLAYNAAYNAARGAALDLVRGVALDAAWAAARGAILALIAYDDCNQYLQMTYDELKVWATLTEEPASILLLPMVKARELIEAKNEQVV